MFRVTGKEVRSIDIFEPARIENYTRNEDAYSGFKIALRLLRDMKARGLCEYRYDDPDIPFEVHGIFVEWNYDGQGLCELAGNELSHILRNTDVLVVSRETSTWEFAATIYTEA